MKHQDKTYILEQENVVYLREQMLTQFSRRNTVTGAHMINLIIWSKKNGHIRKWFQKTWLGGFTIERTYIRFTYTPEGLLTHYKVHTQEFNFESNTFEMHIEYDLEASKINRYKDSHGNEWTREWGMQNPFEEKMLIPPHKAAEARAIFLNVTAEIHMKEKLNELSISLEKLRKESKGIISTQYRVDLETGGMF